MMSWLLYRFLTAGAVVATALPASTEMVTIPAGPFLRGDENGDPDEKPVQRVLVADFAIDRTETTAEQYEACVAARACSALPQKSSSTSQRLPVTKVSWQEASKFCQWLDKRLPTESEWEKAARGTDGRRYPWGNEFACQRGNFGNFSQDGRCAEEGAPGRPVAVGSYPTGASPYGVLDMAGNVWEWTADAYRPDAYRRAESAAVRAGLSDKLRVLRGGGCCSIFGLPRTADRLALPLDYRDEDIGFRCAKDVPAASPAVPTPSPRQSPKP